MSKVAEDEARVDFGDFFVERVAHDVLLEQERHGVLEPGVAPLLVSDRAGSSAGAAPITLERMVNVLKD